MDKNNKTTTTAASTVTELNINEAIEMMEKMQTDAETVKKNLHQMVATVAALGGLKTMLAPYVPKGIIIIGTGEPFGGLSKEPKITPVAIDERIEVSKDCFAKGRVRRLKDDSDLEHYIWKENLSIRPEEQDLYADLGWFEERPDKFKIY